MHEVSEAELKKLMTSTRLDKETREGFDWIRGEIHHGIDWNNLPKLRKISKQLTELQNLIEQGTEEIKAGKDPAYRPGNY